MEIEPDKLTEAFSDAVGAQRAEEIVAAAAAATSAGESEVYTTDEAKAIADHIANNDDLSTFVSISANTLKTRITTGEF